MNVIELFAGCGGLALGLKRAGWKGVFAVERDPMAFETLNENMIKPGAPFKAFDQWPDWLPKSNLDIVSLLNDADIREKLAGLRGAIDLVAGGPPCQGFSVGGRRDGEDSRNELVFRMLEFVELIQPTAVLIENVEGMARKFVSKPGQAKQSIADEAVDELRRLGYQAAYQIVTASDFGVPQIRKRVAIVAVRGAVCGLGGLLSETLKQAADDVRKRHGLAVGRAITTREAIDDLAGSTRVPCPDSPGYDAGTYTDAKSAFAKAMRKGVKSEIPNSHRFTKHGEQVRALYELAHNTQPKGRLSKEFLLSAGTKKDKKVLLDPDAAVQTITTHPDEYIHYIDPRNITVREMARLQSFPDLFTFHGRYTINGPRRKFDVARCSQVGNAVPPLMGEGLGLALERIIGAVIVGDDNVDVAA
ncbi:DNA cytosine methyltransferase [Rhizobium rhizogenes]|uniref:DNA cytosine methyltransferase n=1 Tax=Rhizobium rhizogenes TaxID=359 RepID=UPI001573DD8F|nr:DNA cytosine methyltransferase [Rhizobium rhizogenes]NTF83612.1 DNA cytosine methyltransferase [Rhizobium rhizogenes]